MTRINKALEARLAAVRANDKGFTLIELLVVVIIIGILAAIAIPVYIGVQNNAKDAAVKSDLTNAQIALVAYFTADPAATAPTTATAASLLGTYGYKKSTDVQAITISGTPTSTAFCISTLRVGGTAATDTYKITQDGAAVKGAC